MTLTGARGILEELHKRLYERVLGVELTHYLGYPKRRSEALLGDSIQDYRDVRPRNDGARDQTLFIMKTRKWAATRLPGEQAITCVRIL